MSVCSMFIGFLQPSPSSSPRPEISGPSNPQFTEEPEKVSLDDITVILNCPTNDTFIELL